MATKVAVRYVSRRFSSGGKILSEEEKAAENIYIKGKKAEDTSASSGGADAKASDSTASIFSADVVAGVAAVVAGGALGWYLYFKRVQQELLSSVRESNNKTVMELNKRSGSFCTKVHMGLFRTRMEFSILKGIGPAGPNENLTENGNEDENEVEENGVADTE